MVSVYAQALNSASIKANVSMDNLKLKVAKEDLDSHLQRV
jgi:hypothetical protein